MRAISFNHFGIKDIGYNALLEKNIGIVIICTIPINFSTLLKKEAISIEKAEKQIPDSIIVKIPKLIV